MSDQQEGWSLCVKCGSLFFEGATANVCPAGESHKSREGRGDYEYILNRRRRSGH